MKKLIKFLFPVTFALAIFGCASVENECLGSVFEISYRDENYMVPKGETWKLTWESPYKPNEITPVYDVRVLGPAYTSKDRGTALHGHKNEPGCGLLNINAGKTPASIWISENTEFYIANHRIKVTVEAHSLK